ncbi:MAG: YbaK/EbsC family protein [Xanthomonadales bacterium]|nr:YbaK/EbsC family protein [Xanthomonadales bacterium]
MPVQQLKDFLDREGVRYVSIKHSQAFTAQEIAASAHIKGKELAKTVIVRIDGKYCMAVLPASYHIHMGHLQDALKATSVALATEEEFADMFADCELGAMPPFGNLYDMDVYVAQELTEDEVIAFNAGSHTELFRLTYKDFEKLVQPTVIQLT